MGFLTTAKSDEATFSAFAPQAKRLEDALNCLVDTHKLMGSWIRQQKMERIFAVSTRFLEMMAEVTLGWLLLDSMMVAKRALVANDSHEPKDSPEPKKAESSLEPEEQAFYQGKIQSGLFFMNNTLPNVFAKAQVIALEDDSAEEASAEMFLSRREV